MKISPSTLLLTFLALNELPTQERPAVTLNKRVPVKRDRTPKAKKPGRGNPAKGYDPDTKTWRRP